MIELTIPNGAYRLANARVPRAMLAGSVDYAGDREDVAFVDIDIGEDGMILRIAPIKEVRTAASEAPTVDLAGRHVWAGLIDAHAHLDKAYTWARAPNRDGTLSGAREAAKVDRVEPWTLTEVASRMDFALRCAFAHGTVGLRTHIDSQEGRALPSWPAFRKQQLAWTSRIELQGVATLGAAKLMGSYGEEVARLAKRHGAIALGPVVYRSECLEAEILRSFELAESHGLDLDFHVDETGDPDSDGLRAIALLAMARSFKGRVICGHNCSLARQERSSALATISIVRRARIGVVTLPSSNLYLQDRDASRTPTWRGTTLVRELADAGVPVAIAGDNACDAFNPYADLDMVDAFRDAVRLAHLDIPSIGSWPGAISVTPAVMTGMTDASGLIAKGQRADLIIFEGRNYAEVLARRGHGRIVIRGGCSINVTPPSFMELASK